MRPSTVVQAVADRVQLGPVQLGPVQLGLVQLGLALRRGLSAGVGDRFQRPCGRAPVPLGHANGAYPMIAKPVRREGPATPIPRGLGDHGLSLGSSTTVIETTAPLSSIADETIATVSVPTEGHNEAQARSVAASLVHCSTPTPVSDGRPRSVVRRRAITDVLSCGRGVDARSLSQACSALSRSRSRS